MVGRVGSDVWVTGAGIEAQREHRASAHEAAVRIEAQCERLGSCCENRSTERVPT